MELTDDQMTDMWLTANDDSWDDKKYCLESMSEDAVLKKLRTQRREYTHKYKYGITYEQKLQLMSMQGGRCASCGDSFENMKPKFIHTDHNHATNRVNAVLCGNCNVAVGHLQNDAQRTRKLLAYVEKHYPETI